MIRYTREQTACEYDAFADVLYVTFTRAQSIVGTETPHGFVVRKDRASGELVGVTILDYVSTYGSHWTEVRVDAPTPFVVEVDPVDCGLAAFG